MSSKTSTRLRRGDEGGEPLTATPAVTATTSTASAASRLPSEPREPTGPRRRHRLEQVFHVVLLAVPFSRASGGVGSGIGGSAHDGLGRGFGAGRRCRRTRPRAITITRSAMPSTSGSSDETITIGEALGGTSSADEAVYRGLRADIDALGRLVEDQHLAAGSPATWRSRPSAGCRRRACFDRHGKSGGHAHLQTLGIFAHRATSRSRGRAVEAPSATVFSREARQRRCSPRSALLQHRAHGAAALFRHVDDAGADRIARAERIVERPPVDQSCRPALGTGEPEQRLA